MGLSRSRYLLKNTAIFTLGNLATKLISFFMVPLYTNALNTSQYGTIDLVINVSTVAVPILTLNICESVMRFNLDKGADVKKITKIGESILMLGILVGLLLIPICNCIELLSEYAVLVYFSVITSASAQIFLADLRGKELLIQYSIGNIINTLIIAMSNILFLLVFNWEVRGYLLAVVLSNGIVTLYALIVGKGYQALFTQIDIKITKAMLKYSIVLIPNSFMWWIMNSSDHVMVTSMVGVAANGIYSISYKLPTLISTFIGIFNQAWSYSAIKEQGTEDEAEYSNRIFSSMIAMVMIIGTGMMTFIKPFLKIYVSVDYYGAWKYTPFLIVGCVYLALATFMSTSYTVHKDSFGFLVSGVFGAVLNVVLNFMLIPLMGVYGAALATCTSYIAVFIFRLIHTRKYMRYHVITREFIMGSVALIMLGGLMYRDNAFAQLLQIIIFITVMVLFKKKWTPYCKVFLSKVKNTLYKK